MKELAWAGEHPPLLENRSGSIARVKSQIHKLKRDKEKLIEYNMSTMEIKSGILEFPLEEPAGQKVF